MSNKLTKQQVEYIVEAILEYADFEVEVNGYRDYSVTPSVGKIELQKIRDIINSEITSKKKHKFWRIRK